MYRNIVVGTDGSETASRAVSHAIELAVISGATLHIATAGIDRLVVVTGAAGLPVGADLNVDRLSDNMSEVVNSAANEARSRGASVATHTIVGNAVDALCDLAEQVEADLLVVGNRGMKGLQRFFWDSVPDGISHNAPCSVLIVDTRGSQSDD